MANRIITVLYKPIVENTVQIWRPVVFANICGNRIDSFPLLLGTVIEGLIIICGLIIFIVLSRWILIVLHLPVKQYKHM